MKLECACISTILLAILSSVSGTALPGIKYSTSKSTMRDAEGNLFSVSSSNAALAVRGGKMDEIENGNETGLQIFLDTIRESRKHLAAAGVARCISILAMFPVDTIKTRLQMSLPSPFAAKGLYTGLGGSLVGQVPYGVLTFGSYEMYKKALLEKFPEVKPAFIYAIAAVCGDVTGSGWLCPSEVVKQQSQAGMYASTGDAVRGIYAKKGFGGFYQGYLGGLARDVPFRVSQLVSYEVAKNSYLNYRKKKNGDGSDNDDDNNLTPVESAICGAVAGSFSAAFTAPLDRIKTILMTDSVEYGGTVASVVTKIWRDEGVAGLCQGLVPRVVLIAPSVAIFFIAYEQVQQRLSHLD